MKSSKKSNAASQRIKQVRSHLGLTQKEISETIGVTQANWSRLEAGEIGLSNTVKKLLAHKLGVNEGFLESGELPMMAKEGATQEVPVQATSALEEKILMMEKIIENQNKIIALYEAKMKA